MRPLHNSAVSVTVPDMVLEVEVSAFSPILQVLINGESEAFDPSDWVIIKKQIQLEYGKNEFIVEAKAEEGKGSKTFVIFYDPDNEELAKKDREKRFKLVGVFGGQYATNPAKIDGGDSAIKGLTVIIPRYDKPLDSGASLRYKGILFRDKYLDADFKGLETAYTQLTLSRVAPMEGADNWEIGFGLKQIGTQFENPVQYKYDVRQDIFLFYGLHKATGEEGFYEIGLDFASQTYEGSTPDATVLTLKGRFQKPTSKFSGSYAVESYDGGDTTTINLGGEFIRPAGQVSEEGGEPGRWALGTGAKVRSKDFSGVVSATRITLLVNAKNKLSKSKTFVWEFIIEQQSSDSSSLEYDNMAVTGSIIIGFL